jgi:tRNA threonylcarbamoyladenosine biosynthesis protein TsaE
VSHEPLIPPLADHGRLACTLDELVTWGERFGKLVSPPLIVTIAGELGAGKTTLVQAICRGYGVKDDVTSPTFALVHRYAGAKSPVFHLDLYRLERPDELTNLGWDEIMAEEALVLIEWPERAGDRIPRNHVPIDLQHLPSDPSRRLLYAGGHVA